MNLPRPTLFQRISSSIPLLVTVLVHIVLIAIAGYFFVSEQILGKKKSFEAPPPADNSVIQKKVEHRLQVARKGGGSSSTSPVSANRIFSTADNALQLPQMPDLPSVGASALSGMSFGAGAGAAGSGTGYNTGIGSGSGLGRGFMAMSFLGTTSQKASKVVFIVDISTQMMDPRKGGFEAFSIIRDQMMKLISKLSSGAEFGVIVYETDPLGRFGTLSPYARELKPATVSNKQAFFEWLSKINTDVNNLGIKSVPQPIAWRPRELPTAGLKANYNPQAWVDSVRCALEMGPDTIFVVTGSLSYGTEPRNDAEMAKEKARYNEEVRAIKAAGLDPSEVMQARAAALAAARQELNQLNFRLTAKGKIPLVAASDERLAESDFQAAVKKAGESLPIDTKGWSTKEGKLIWYWGAPANWKGADNSELLLHIPQLQRALLRDRAALNIFLFVGPNEQPKASMDILSKIANRNGGTFQLLTTARLKELAGRDQEKK